MFKRHYKFAVTPVTSVTPLKIKKLQGYRNQKHSVTSVTNQEKLQKLQTEKPFCNLVTVAHKAMLQKLQGYRRK